MEMIVVISLLVTFSGIALRLFSQKSLFYNSTNALHAYLRSVCEYTSIGDRRCYLLLGNYQSNEPKIAHLVLAELDMDDRLHFVEGHSYQLHKNETILEPGETNGSQFSLAEISKPTQWKGPYYAVDLSQLSGQDICLMLAFHTSGKVLYQSYRINSNGTLIVEQL
jgi:hypothetical protein